MKCGNCQHDHDTVDEVRACYDSALVASARQPSPASQKQISFIRSLAAERVRPEGADDVLLSRVEAGETIGRQSASDLITTLKLQPHAASKGPTPEGVHLLDGDYVKVQRAIHGSGKLYAKVMVDEGGEPRWDYVGRGPLARLNEDTLLTAEQAARFGLIYGQCVFCGRGLTDERSIDVGYGPTCAENTGLPWG